MRPQVNEPLNVILMLLDDLGPGLLESYADLNGYEQPFPYARTRTLDRLAAKGVRFTQARVAPRCSPTRALIQTGRYAFRTGVGHLVVQSPEPNFALPLSERILPELLGPAGYRCGCIGKWHLGNDTVAADPQAPNAWMHTPNDAGYPHFAGALYNVNSHPAPVERPDYYSWYRVENGNAAMNSTYTTIVQADDAIEFIQAGPEPFFLYLPWTAIHGPFNWPPNELHSYGPKPPDGNGEDGQPFAANTRARAMLETLDREIGRVLGSLTRDVARRTMIIVIGDNGTEKSVLEIEVSDITSVQDPTPPSTAPYDPMRGKSTLYETGVRVPLIVQGPLVNAPGRSVSHLVDGVDIFRTVLSMAGVSGSGPFHRGGGEGFDGVDGVDLLPVLQNPNAAPARQFSFNEIFLPGGLPATGPQAADKAIERTYMDAEGFKLILRRGGNFGAPGEQPTDEVYNVFKDPFEVNPLDPRNFKHLYKAMDALLGL